MRVLLNRIIAALLVGSLLSTTTYADDDSPTLSYSSTNGRFFTTTSVSPTISVVWDKLAQDLVAKRKVGPVSGAATYAVLHTSIFAAWKRSGRYRFNSWRRGAQACSVKLLSMNYAARFALTRLYPNDRADINRVFIKQSAHRSCASRFIRLTSKRIGRTAAVSTSKRYQSSVTTQPTHDDSAPDIEKWQSEHVPIDSMGPMQKPLAPRWGERYTFGIRNAAAIRVPPPKRFYLNDGVTINPQFISQCNKVISISASLTPEQRFSAEAWEAGAGTSYPPGAWMTITQWVSARDRHTVDDDVGLFYAVSNALNDAGVVTWYTKYKYYYARPVRVIRDLGEKGLLKNIRFYNTITSKVVTESATKFITYQDPKGDASPPFPEYTSGHSGFSAAAAEVLKRWTKSDSFDGSIVLNALQSRFERGRQPSRRLNLSWKTFSDAANSAGQSRIYGGIHFDDGNIEGLKLGRKIGAKVFMKAFPKWNRIRRSMPRELRPRFGHRGYLSSSNKLRHIRRRHSTWEIRHYW